MKYLKQLKIKIPEDICVAGFGNNLLGELVEPSLTTYDVNSSKIGETAMQALLEGLKRQLNESVKTITIDGVLIIRDSTIKERFNQKK